MVTIIGVFPLYTPRILGSNPSGISFFWARFLKKMCSNLDFILLTLDSLVVCMLGEEEKPKATCLICEKPMGYWRYHCRTCSKSICIECGDNNKNGIITQYGREIFDKRTASIHEVYKTRKWDSRLFERWAHDKEQMFTEICGTILLAIFLIMFIWLVFYNRDWICEKLMLPADLCPRKQFKNIKCEDETDYSSFPLFPSRHPRTG